MYSLTHVHKCILYLWRHKLSFILLYIYGYLNGKLYDDSFRITSKLDVKNYANWIWYHDNWPCLSFSLFGYNFYKSYIRQYEVYGQYGYYLRLIYVWIYELLLCFLLIINKQKLKYIEKLESSLISNTECRLLKNTYELRIYEN